MKHKIKFLTITTAILYILLLTFVNIININIPYVNWMFFIFFALISTLFIYLLEKIKDKKQQVFINRFLMLTGIRFLVCIIILALILALINDLKILTGIIFLIGFIVFLFAEVILILRDLKKYSNKSLKS